MFFTFEIERATRFSERFPMRMIELGRIGTRDSRPCMGGLAPGGVRAFFNAIRNPPA